MTEVLFGDMRAYKFLDAHGRAPFTGAVWSPGEWVEERAAEPCKVGVHACLPGDVSHWLADDLWEVELDGQLVETRHKVVASRGRLVRRVAEYAAAVHELAAVGAWRSRERAVGALLAAGELDLAERFEAVTTLDGLAALAGDVDDASFAAASAALAADAAHFALHGDHAQSPFVAACSAGHTESGPDGDQDAYARGYAAERAFQSAWLAERLQLG